MKKRKLMELRSEDVVLSRWDLCGTTQSLSAGVCASNGAVLLLQSPLWRCRWDLIILLCESVQDSSTGRLTGPQMFELSVYSPFVRVGTAVCVCVYAVMEIRVASRATSVLRVKQAGRPGRCFTYQRWADRQTSGPKIWTTSGHEEQTEKLSSDRCGGNKTPARQIYWACERFYHQIKSRSLSCLNTLLPVHPGHKLWDVFAQRL